MTTLITGSSGFVGAATRQRLATAGFTVRGIVRTLNTNTPPINGITYHEIGTITPTTDWTIALEGIDTIVHLANRAHVMQEHASNPLAEYRNVNVTGSVNLAQQAAKAGVRRFIFVSSIKVNGEATQEQPFCETSMPNPQDPYGVSKWEAEQALQQIATETSLELVILRPPLMYGAGVKANFLRLMQAIDRGIPLPLGAITHNRRSMLYVGNLADAIATCITHPQAAGQTFLVSDGEDVSTTALIHHLAQALGKPTRLIPIPQQFIQLAGSLTGKNAAVSRLIGSLCIDSSKIRHVLDWSPPFTLENGLQATATWYNTTKHQ
jgi:nucleoside-diphosphate-sugar epimerase